VRKDSSTAGVASAQLQGYLVREEGDARLPAADNSAILATICRVLGGCRPDKPKSY